MAEEFKLDENLLEEALEIAKEGDLNGATNKRALGIIIALILDNRAFNVIADGRLKTVEDHPLHDKTISRVVAFFGFVGLLGGTIAGYRAVILFLGGGG
jgi:hypothetical protein